MIRGATPARGESTSFAEDTESDGCVTNDYTSGAITSDDELIAPACPRSGAPMPKS